MNSHFQGRAERRFQRKLGSLRDVFAFIEAFFENQSIDRAHLNTVQFVVEELFTNAIKYSAGGEHVLLVLERTDGELTVRLTDFCGKPFDIRQAPEARVNLPLEQRRPGGLGIHLIKKMVDRIDYEYTDGRSTTTLVKTLE